MNTNELAAQLAAATGLRKGKSENVLRWLFAKIAEEMSKGEIVKIYGFGQFSALQRSAL